MDSKDESQDGEIITHTPPPTTEPQCSVGGGSLHESTVSSSAPPALTDSSVSGTLTNQSLVQGSLTESGQQPPASSSSGAVAASPPPPPTVEASPPLEAEPGSRLVNWLKAEGMGDLVQVLVHENGFVEVEDLKGFAIAEPAVFNSLVPVPGQRYKLRRKLGLETAAPTGTATTSATSEGPLTPTSSVEPGACPMGRESSPPPQNPNGVSPPTNQPLPPPPATSTQASPSPTYRDPNQPSTASPPNLSVSKRSKSMHDSPKVRAIRDDGAERTDWKICLVGPKAAGKSCFVRRLKGQNFDASTAVTIGVDYFRLPMTITAGGKKIDLSVTLSDIPGQDVDGLIKQQVGGTRGTLLLFDCSRGDSLKRALEMRQAVKARAPNAPCLLVGTKMDLPESEHVLNHKMPQEVHKVLHENQLCGFAMCSAKKGEGINTALELLLSHVWEEQERPPVEGVAKAEATPAPVNLKPAAGGAKKPFKAEPRKKSGCSTA